METVPLKTHNRRFKIAAQPPHLLSPHLTASLPLALNLLTSRPHALNLTASRLTSSVLTSRPHFSLSASPPSLSLDSVLLLSFSPSLTPLPQSSISHRQSSQAADISLTKS
uniref:Uncharacterized protein n=1 Tax=Fagus sylvatica TaxID=28930 RepID=A0A2N9H3B8_FAGSY